MHCGSVRLIRFSHIFSLGNHVNLILEDLASPFASCSFFMPLLLLLLASLYPSPPCLPTFLPSFTPFMSSRPFLPFPLHFAPPPCLPFPSLSVPSFPLAWGDFGGPRASLTAA